MSRGATWIILGATVGLIACSVGTFVMIRRCQKRDIMCKMKMLEVSLVPYRYSELKEMTNYFSQRMGGGGYGFVFKGMLSDPIVVALKKLEGIAQREKQFQSEVSTLGVIQREHMTNGSLDSHLFRSTSMVLDWKIRYRISLGIARGLHYLHEKCRDCISHCDVKPENILLDASFVPEMAKFGLARLSTATSAVY